MITVASCITFIRIIVTPVVIYYIHLQAWAVAACYFAIAAATDLVDGFIARKLKQESNFGQLLDPIADKILIMSTLYSLLLTINTNVWQQSVIYFLLLKETILLTGGAWLKLRYNFFIKPSKLSRTASLAEIVLIAFLFIELIWAGTVSNYLFSYFLAVNFFISAWLLVRYAKIVHTSVTR